MVLRVNSRSTKNQPERSNLQEESCHEMKLFIITSVIYFTIKRKQSNIPKLFQYIYIKQKRIQITTCSAKGKMTIALLLT